MNANFHSSPAWRFLGRRLAAFCAALAVCRPGLRGIGTMAAALFALALSWPAQAAPFAYITNTRGNTVSVLDTASNTVLATVPVGTGPFGVAVSPDGARVYVTGGGSVSVIATASNTVVATVPVGPSPQGVAVTPDGARVYVTNYGSGSGNVSVIATASNTVVATVHVAGSTPLGVAVTPDGARVYVANYGSATVSVVDTASNTVLATVPVGTRSFGVAVSPDGARVYVANQGSGNVSVIATASNTVVATVAVGASPAAFGRFIGPAATFPFSGFFSPVDNPPTLNAMKAGAAVPVKFSLGGARGLDVIAANFPQSMPVACANGAPVDVVELTLTAGKSSLSYDVATDTYTYAWKTNQAWAGTCRELTVRLSDGSVHKALFQFK